MWCEVIYNTDNLIWDSVGSNNAAEALIHPPIHNLHKYLLILIKSGTWQTEDRAPALASPHTVGVIINDTLQGVSIICASHFPAIKSHWFIVFCKNKRNFDWISESCCFVQFRTRSCFMSPSTLWRRVKPEDGSSNWFWVLSCRNSYHTDTEI